MTRNRFLKLLGLLGLGVGAAPLVPRVSAGPEGAADAAAAATGDVHSLLAGSIVVDALFTPYRKGDRAWPRLAGESKRLTGIDAGCWDVGDVSNLANINVLVETYEAGVMRIDAVDDLSVARAAGRLGVIFYAARYWKLAGSLEPLARWHEQGLRVMQIAGDGATELGGTFDDDDAPLSTFGKNVVSEMNERGLLIDVSLSGARTTRDVAAASSRPIVSLHSNARSLTDHERNKTDDEIKAIAGTGGLVAATTLARCLRQGDEAVVTAQRLVDHVDRLVQVAGIDHVGLASDGSLDGRPRYVYDETDLVGYDRWFRLATSLRESGYSDEDMRKIFGRNMMRVLRATIG